MHAPREEAGIIPPKNIESLPMFVNSNLFHQISTFDSNFLFCHQMLNYNVRHVFSKSISKKIKE